MARNYFALTKIQNKVAKIAAEPDEHSKPSSSRQMPTDQPIENHAKGARRLFLISGIAVLLWSGMEDNDALLVTLLGALLATAATMMLFASHRLRPLMARGSRPRRMAIAGATIGTLASVDTPLLMLFKDIRHAHIYPDYPAGMMLATLERMPAWALAGRDWHRLWHWALAQTGRGSGWRKSR